MFRLYCLIQSINAIGDGGIFQGSLITGGYVVGDFKYPGLVHIELIVAVSIAALIAGRIGDISDNVIAYQDIREWGIASIGHSVGIGDGIAIMHHSWVSALSHVNSYNRLNPISTSTTSTTTTSIFVNFIRIWESRRSRCLTRYNGALHTFWNLNFYALSNSGQRSFLIKHYACPIFSHRYNRSGTPDRRHPTRYFDFIAGGQVSQVFHPADGFAYLLVDYDGCGTGILRNI